MPCALFSDWPCTSSVVADEIVPCRLASVPVLTDTALPISAPLVFVRDWLRAVSVVPACSTPLAFVTAPAVASSAAAAAMAPPVLSSAPVPVLTVTLRPATVPAWLPRLAADSAMSCAASSLPLALVTLPALVTVRLPPLEPSTPPAVLSRPATVALRLPAAATVPPWLTRLPAWIVAAPDAETAPRVLSSVPEPVLRFRPRAEIAPPWLPRLVAALKVASCAAMSLPLALAIPLALLMLNLPAAGAERAAGIVQVGHACGHVARRSQRAAVVDEAARGQVDLTGGGDQPIAVVERAGPVFSAGCAPRGCRPGCPGSCR